MVAEFVVILNLEELLVAIIDNNKSVWRNPICCLVSLLNKLKRSPVDDLI